VAITLPITTGAATPRITPFERLSMGIDTRGGDSIATHFTDAIIIRIFHSALRCGPRHSEES
jgi:hypothetical protein